MYQYGTTREHLAEVAVAARKWAQLTPGAFARDPLSVEEVLASRFVSPPITALDCCLMTDGGTVYLESGFSESTRKELAARGHHVDVGASGHGGYQAIKRDEKNGVWFGASESRKDGHAAGY